MPSDRPRPDIRELLDAIESGDPGGFVLNCGRSERYVRELYGLAPDDPLEDDGEPIPDLAEIDGELGIEGDSDE